MTSAATSSPPIGSSLHLTRPRGLTPLAPHFCHSPFPWTGCTNTAEPESPGPRTPVDRVHGAPRLLPPPLYMRKRIEEKKATSPLKEEEEASSSKLLGNLTLTLTLKASHGQGGRVGVGRRRRRAGGAAAALRRRGHAAAAAPHAVQVRPAPHRVPLLQCRHRRHRRALRRRQRPLRRAVLPHRPRRA